ncbi:MAG: potassium channel family protein [bacterium]|nr:potassium channel family protein [bacterium]
MSWLRTLAKSDEDEGAFGRHAVLLGSLILLLVALPLVQIATGRSAGFPPMLALVMVAAVVVNSHQRGIFLVAIGLGGAAIVGLGLAEYTDATTVRVISGLIALALLGLTTLVMLNGLIQADQVSRDTIVGGICVYLLVGLCFAVAFILLAQLDPDAFTSGAPPIPMEDRSRHATQLLYFSFVTLTTLGYGDIAPRSDLAQMFAVSEALIGQLYLTIFVARLVALYVGRRRNEPTV